MSIRYNIIKNNTMNPKDIAINNYTYHLPNEKIAFHPLNERDASKLLIYQHGIIQNDYYKNIAQYLPDESLLIFNNTKVINARIIFNKPTGGQIEIFCLEPYEAIKDYSVVMSLKGKCKWKCLIGGVSKWKENKLKKELGIRNLELELWVELIEKLSDAYVVEFSWQPSDYSFAEILAATGNIPLPPYIKRNVENDDSERYQTVYAQHQGSVAAPTAGLHFTDTIFKKLEEKQIAKEFVTLHVGAGTFKPVKAATMEQHEMHAEWIDVSIESIEKILQYQNKMIVAVGTTSLRTIESLFWLGVKAYQNPYAPSLSLQQWDVYEDALANTNLNMQQALSALLNWLRKNNLTKIFTQTQIIIAPGYTFRIAKAIITNFHQPQSTLLLLVAAAIGNDWRKVYDHALQNDYRFLSYGDGSLLFINK